MITICQIPRLKLSAEDVSSSHVETMLTSVNRAQVRVASLAALLKPP